VNAIAFQVYGHIVRRHEEADLVRRLEVLRQVVVPWQRDRLTVGNRDGRCGTAQQRQGQQSREQRKARATIA
jgi:hypothetical protein